MDSHGPSSLAADVEKLHVGCDGEPKPHDPKSTHGFDCVIKNGHRVLDITDRFAEACSSLEVGELVKNESFTLFESVQALEVMDPKMDNGYLAPRETLYDYYDVTTDLAPEEVVGIMDQLLCYELSWHRGYPLAQNLFISHHIDNLLSQELPPHTVPYFVNLDGKGGHREAGPLVQLVLRSFCIATIISCQQVTDVIWSQQYYEDEDFSSFNFGRDMLSRIPDSDCLNLVQNAIQWISNHLDAMEPETAKALICRLSLRSRSFGLKEQCLSHRVDWNSLKNTLQTVRETHGRATPVKEAFSAKIQRKLANTSAPRPIVDLDFESACQQLKEMYEDVEEASRIFEPEADIEPQPTLAFIWQYASRIPAPSTFARGMLQTFLFGENGALGMENVASFLVEELRSVLPDNLLDVSHWHVEVPSSSRYTLARHLDFFIDRAAPVWMNVFRCLCQNRCRMRRCLSNVLMELVALRNDLRARRQLLYERSELDNESESLNYNFLLVEFVVEQLRYRATSWVLLFGFEQELYQPWEFSSMYCCLDEVYSKNAHDLDILLKYHTDKFENGERQWSVSAAVPLSPRASWMKVALLMARMQSDEIVHNLSTVFSLIYMITARLDRSNLFTQRGMAFGSRKLQLELRLKPFNSRLPAEPSASTHAGNGSDRNDNTTAEEEGDDRAGELALSPELVESLIAQGSSDWAASLHTCTQLLANVKRRIKFQTDILFGRQRSARDTGPGHHSSAKHHDSNDMNRDAQIEQETLRKALGVTPTDLWWRDSLRATLRATLKASLLLSKLNDVYTACDGDMDALAQRYIVDIKIPPLEKREHHWWILPDITWAIV